MVGLVEKAESLSPRVDNWGCMIVGKLGMTAKLQGRAGSAQLWLDSWKRLKVCRHVDNWGYDR